MPIRKSPFLLDTDAQQFLMNVMQGFLKSTKLRLPPKRLEAYLKILKQACTERQYNELIAHHEQTDYSDIKSILFFEEMILSTFLSRTGQISNSFDRGRREVAMLEPRSISIYERHKLQYPMIADILRPVLLDDLMRLRPRVCLEIGCAWCSTTDFIVNNCKPETYYVFEIDETYSKYAEEKYGCISKECDGETFGDVADGSVDLVIVHNVYALMPIIKQYSYMRETARVLRQGGKSFFNISLADRRTRADLDAMLDKFPQRSYALFPEVWLREAFPREEFDLEFRPQGETLYVMITKR